MANSTKTKGMARMDDERSAGRLLRGAGVTVVLLGIVLLVVHPAAPVSSNVSGFISAVVGFELASRPEEVIGILGEPGTDAHATAVRWMVRGTRLDFLFALAYPLFYVAIALVLHERGLVTRSVALGLFALAGTMAVGDIAENRELLRLCRAETAAAMIGPLARLGVYTRIKWGALYAASGAIAWCVRRDVTWWRWSALPFGAAAGLGLWSLAHLPAIEYSSWALTAAWAMTCVHAFGRSPASRSRRRDEHRLELE
jgi:hypothetical protein